jgi:acyl dehydratase
MLFIGQVFSLKFNFTQDNVVAFAQVTGDNNPVHLDENYAAGTIFKKPIVHGMLGASLFSKVFGTMFPGEGTIYLNQSLNFLKPMYVNQNYEAIFEVKEIISEKNRAVITTTIKNEEGKALISGEALLMNTEKIK